MTHDEILQLGENLATRSLVDLWSLTGRVAVVTGGARGIGLAIVRRLTEVGARVVMSDISQEALDAGMAQLTDAQRALVVTQPANVAKTEPLVALAERAKAISGKIDIWVNNAGIFPATGPVTGTSDEVYERVVDVNLRGTFVACREAANRMERGGVIVNIASTAGLKGYQTIAAYTAAKHGVVGLTKAMAIELGGAGIRVVAIAPGGTETPGVVENREKMAGQGRAPASGSDMPLGRRCLPDDIARGVLFAASDMAAMVTGSVICVDGGTMA